jgi:hypothetical protein
MRVGMKYKRITQSTKASGFRQFGASILVGKKFVSIVFYVGFLRHTYALTRNDEKSFENKVVLKIVK